MTRRKLSRLAVIAVALQVSIGLLPSTAHAAQTVVFAASSLKDALDAASALYKERTGESLAVSYAGSATLARQIEDGAPADIFFSADVKWMNYLEERSLIDTDSRVDLLGNDIALVAPRDSEATLTIGPDMDVHHLLGADGRIAMGEVSSVPAGLYGKAALEHYDAWSPLANRIVQADSVRGALAFVASGEAPLGIVYVTDAVAEPAVRIIDVFPAASHLPIVYPLALTAASDNSSAAAFLDFLKSAGVQSVFADHGFIHLRPDIAQ